MRTLTTIAALFCILAGCGQQEVRPYGTETCQTNSPAQVQVLYSFPQAAHTKVGGISVKHGQIGFTDPTVADASEKLQEAGFELGGEAVVVTDSNQTGERQVFVTAEAICFR